MLQIVPRDGSPLRGLIQDHIVAGALLTKRDQFFTLAEYQQLVYSCCFGTSRKITTLPPAILKPVKLWTGLIFSFLLFSTRDLNLQGFLESNTCELLRVKL